MLQRARSTARRWLRRSGAPSEPVSHRDAADDALRHATAELAAVAHRLDASVASIALELQRLRDLTARVAAHHDAIEALGHRRRRDLGDALDRLATATTAELVARSMTAARTFDHPHDTLRWALSQAPPDGLALEFGVGAGTTLRIITPTRPRGTVFGFDSFKGLPETWRTHFDAGTFAVDAPPVVPHAELVIGLFEDTLPVWAAEHPEPLAFLHLDADLYSSTATVLEHIGDRLVDGTIVVFDEYFNYPGWPDHEHRAWTEFVERSGVGFAYVAYTRDDEQVVVRITRTGT
jgi:SAM-dependent methyltransferase